MGDFEPQQTPPEHKKRKKTLPPAFGIRKSCHPTIDGAIQRKHVPRERRFFGDSKNSMWQQQKGAGIESWEMNWILTNTMGTQNSFDLHYMLRSWKLAPRIKTEKYDGNFVMTNQLANCTLFHFKPGKKYDFFFSDVSSVNLKLPQLRHQIWGCLMHVFFMMFHLQSPSKIFQNHEPFLLLLFSHVY